MILRASVSSAILTLASIAVAWGDGRGTAACLCSAFIYVAIFATRGSTAAIVRATAIVNERMQPFALVLDLAVAALLSAYLAITIAGGDRGRLLTAIEVVFFAIVAQSVVRLIVLRRWTAVP